MSRKFVSAILILVLLAGTAGAENTAPSTYSVGYNLWSHYWDFRGNTGAVNGTIGGFGLPMFFIGNGSGLSSLNASNLTNLQTVYKDAPQIGNGVTTNFTTYAPVLVNSSEVKINGLYQTYGAAYAYVEWSHGINFTAAPGNGYVIDIEYVGS